MLVICIDLGLMPLKIIFFQTTVLSMVYTLCNNTGWHNNARKILNIVPDFWLML